MLQHLRQSYFLCLCRIRLKFNSSTPRHQVPGGSKITSSIPIRYTQMKVGSITGLLICPHYVPNFIVVRSRRMLLPPCGLTFSWSHVAVWMLTLTSMSRLSVTFKVPTGNRKTRHNDVSRLSQVYDEQITRENLINDVTPIINATPFPRRLTRGIPALNRETFHHLIYSCICWDFR